jgi:hypothetical protein
MVDEKKIKQYINEQKDVSKEIKDFLNILLRLKLNDINNDVNIEMNKIEIKYNTSLEKEKSKLDLAKKKYNESVSLLTKEREENKSKLITSTLEDFIQNSLKANQLISSEKK